LLVVINNVNCYRSRLWLSPTV